MSNKEGVTFSFDGDSFYIASEMSEGKHNEPKKTLKQKMKEAQLKAARGKLK